MLSRYQTWAIYAVAGLNALAVMAADDCSPGCANDFRNQKFRDYKCNAADEVGCLCGSADFLSDVAKCAMDKCQAAPDVVAASLMAPGHICANLVVQMPSQTPASGSPASTGTPTKSTSSPTSTTTTPAETTSSTTPTPATTPATTTTESISTSSSMTSGESSSSATPTNETSPTSSPAAAAGGISQGAAIGVGVGVAAAVVAIAAVAFCLLKKRTKAAPRHSMEISKPLPGSGRTYPTRDTHDRDRDSFDKYGNDIEMTANRYEDMIPSQQPRTMV